MRLLTEHGRPIDWLTFSPDSRRLLATSRPPTFPDLFDSETLRLWDLAAGTSQVLRRAFTPAFTPDGRSVLYGSGEDGSPQLFDLASGKAAPLKLPDHGPGIFWWPLFTPDGSRLLSVGSWKDSAVGDGLVLQWNAYPGWQAVGYWRMNEWFGPALARWSIFTAAFSPCGKTLATVAGRGLMLFDVATGKLSHRKNVDPQDTVHFLTYHPSGRQLAFGWGTKVVVFDTRSWNQVAEVRQKKKHILSGAFTPDGRSFLTASDEETVKCWDAATWTLKREYAWEIGGLRSVAVAPDGMTAVAGGDSAEVVLFDLDD
jgi:WD40 repeat protein